MSGVRRVEDGEFHVVRVRGNGERMMVVHESIAAMPAVETPREKHPAVLARLRLTASNSRQPAQRGHAAMSLGYANSSYVGISQQAC